MSDDIENRTFILINREGWGYTRERGGKQSTLVTDYVITYITESLYVAAPVSVYVSLFLLKI